MKLSELIARALLSAERRGMERAAKLVEAAKVGTAGAGTHDRILDGIAATIRAEAALNGGAEK